MGDLVRATVSLRPWRRILPLGALLLAGCAAAGVEGETALARAPSVPVAAIHARSPGTPDRPAVPSPVRLSRGDSTDAAASLARVKRFRSVRGHVQAAPPWSVRIPAIRVDSSLVTLGRQRDGTVEVPAEWSQAGWFSEGPSPGEPGPAVILGHVDSRAGPAVFYRLHELRRGDEILVELADRSTVQFTVDRVEHHAKDAFPTRAVYFPTLKPTLRLVTCGGVLDPQARSYRDNVIVFAARSR